MTYDPQRKKCQGLPKVIMKPGNVLMLVQGWIGLVGFCLFYCNPVTTTQTFMALPTGEGEIPGAELTHARRGPRHFGWNQQNQQSHKANPQMFVTCKWAQSSPEDQSADLVQEQKYMLVVLSHWILGWFAM